MGLSLIKADMEKAYPGLTNDGISSHPQQSNIEKHMQEWYGQVLEVMENAESSVDVLNELLAYDKIEMGSFKLDLTIVPCWALVEKTFREFQLAAGKKDLSFSLSFYNSSCDRDSETNAVQTAKELSPATLQSVVIADPFRISQILRNLLSNAIKFCQSQGTSSIWRKMGCAIEMLFLFAFSLCSCHRLSLISLLHCCLYSRLRAW
jgi:signal transduction histidine kinase